MVLAAVLNAAGDATVICYIVIHVLCMYEACHNCQTCFMISIYHIMTSSHRHVHVSYMSQRSTLSSAFLLLHVFIGISIWTGLDRVVDTIFDEDMILCGGVTLCD